LIRVTKLNGEVFYINPYEIEFIEETPDTVISLKSGKKVLVVERVDAIINEMIDFYRRALPITRNVRSDGADEAQADPVDSGDGESPD
jgi:flagellar protein FlbD